MLDPRMTSIFFILLCTLALLMGCGSDGSEWSNSDSSNGGGDSWSTPECVPGLGECPTSDICVVDSCRAIDLLIIPLTIEFGEFPWTRNFQVEVRYRGDDLILRTDKSNSTSTPSWFETVNLLPHSHTDWWSIEVISHGTLLSNTVLTCYLDFDAPTFEVESNLFCDNEDGYISILVEPMS